MSSLTQVRSTTDISVLTGMKPGLFSTGCKSFESLIVHLSVTTVDNLSTFAITAHMADGLDMRLFKMTRVVSIVQIHHDSINIVP